MATFTLPSGIEIDIGSGDVTGATKPVDVSSKQMLSTQKVDAIKPMSQKTAVEALQQLSWGFNSALFALPDEVVKSVGVHLGVKPEDIPTFTQYFNAGQVAPQTALERFSGAIGKGVGSALPFTGVLGAVARTKTLASTLAPDAGVLKRIAKDTLDFIRKNPRAAVAADAGFAALFEASAQGVEEFMDPGTTKDYARALVPTASTLAIPSVLGMANKLLQYSPTIRAAKALTGGGSGQAPKDILAEDIAGDPLLQQYMTEKAPKIPGVTWALGRAQRHFANGAAKRVQEITKPLLDPDMADTQAALKVSKDIEDWLKSDPTLKNLNLSDRWLLDAAQASLYAPLVAARDTLTKQLSGDLLKREVLREQDLSGVFNQAFDSLAPKAQLPLDDALRIYYAEDQASLAKAVQQVKDLTDTQAIEIADRFKALDLSEVGDNLRRSVLAQMEGQYSKLTNEFKQLNLRFGLTPEGVPTAVRNEMEVTPYVPSAAFENFARGFISKYALGPADRLFPTTMPPPVVRATERYLQRFEKQVEAQKGNFTEQLYRQWMSTGDRFGANLNPEDFETFIKPLARDFKKVASGKMTPDGFREKHGKSALPDEKQYNVIKENAEKLAKDNVEFRLTLPEAVDLLGLSLRSKGHSLLEYNKRLTLGVNRKDAQRVLDVSNEMHHDVKKFVFGQFDKSPELRGWMDKYEDTFTNGYEKYFPMLITQKRPTGEPYLSSESIVSEALKSADNIRALKFMFGEDNPSFNQTLQDVMYDQAYRAGAVGKDGLLDVQRYDRWLQTKKNLIDAMPEPVRATLLDEAKAGKKLHDRLRDMNQRVEDMQDLELERSIKQSLRPGASSRELIAKSVSDPAVMRQLVDRFKSDPVKLQSLRRQVWLSVKDDLFDPTRPTFLKEFLVKNGKSLNMMYDAQHMDNLRMLGEMQHRVFAADTVVGRVSPFQSTDERLQSLIGASVSNIESTARAAMIRQISIFHAGTSLLARLVSRQQGNVYEAILYKALTDPRYAHELVTSTAQASGPAGQKQMARLTSKAGYDYPSTLLTSPKIEINEMITQDRAIPAFEQTDLPPTPEPVAPQPAPQAAPSAGAVPAAAGRLPQSNVARRVVPPMPSPNVVGMESFANLFPEDFVAPVIQSRAAQNRQP